MVKTNFSGQYFSGKIFGAKSPSHPPQILEALQKAHSALFLSTPAVSLNPSQLAAHKAAYQAVATILIELQALKPMT